jgi:hypothetical protein
MPPDFTDTPYLKALWLDDPDASLQRLDSRH